MKLFNYVIVLSLSVILLSSSSFAQKNDNKNNQKIRVHPWFAVKCLSLSAKCTPFFAKHTGGVCKPARKWHNQPNGCIKKACEWCLEWKMRTQRFPCAASRVVRSCRKYIRLYGDDHNKGNAKPTPEPENNMGDNDMDNDMDMDDDEEETMYTPEPMMNNEDDDEDEGDDEETMSTPGPMMDKDNDNDNDMGDEDETMYTPEPTMEKEDKPKDKHNKGDKDMDKDTDMNNTDDGDKNYDMNDGTCTWKGEGDNIVIDLGAVRPGKGWEKVNRDGWRGIIFKTSPAKGISPKGQYGKMCFNVQAPMDGKYYLTAISYAPHVTEHNDVWVQSGKGFELWQSGNMRTFSGAEEWLKAYQNNGVKGMSEHFKTIDHDGHRFLIPDVKQGERFKVCIAGRSKLYEMYRLMLVKCEGKYCEGGIMKGDTLFNMTPSKCM